MLHGSNLVQSQAHVSRYIPGSIFLERWSLLNVILMHKIGSHMAINWKMECDKKITEKRENVAKWIKTGIF